MKKYAIYGLFGLMLISLLIMTVFTWQAKSGLSDQADKIVIGAVYPLSGTFASYGIEYQRGLEMAVEEINSQGGINGRQLQVIVENDEGDTTKSVNAVNKLINVDKVNYIFTAFSSASSATAPIAEQNQVLYMSATVSKLGTGKYVFRDFWDIEDQGAAIGQAINQEGIKKIGILAMNYGDTEDYLNSIKSQAKNVEFKEERFNFGDTDFKSQLTKIKDFNPDAILVYAFPGAEAMEITKELKDLKLTNKRLLAGATTYGLPFMSQTYSETLSQMKAIDTWYSLDANNQKAVEFARKYQAKYGQQLVGDAAYPYDDVYALAQAIRESGANASTAKVAENLRKVEMDGAAGQLKFDEMGNSQRSAYLQIFTETGWQKYELK